MELLLTIKGVGKVLALVFLILFRKYKGASQKQLTALVGLDTTERVSGKSLRGKPKISKRGDHLIRALLYQGTLSAVRYNPQVRGSIRGSRRKVLRRRKPGSLLLTNSSLLPMPFTGKGCLTIPLTPGRVDMEYSI
ncbi:MAG: transposase [bacterium]